MSPTFFKRSCLALVGAAALAIAGLPASAGAQRAPASTLLLGAYAPLSGPYASAGVDIINAVKLAASDAGKVLGMKVSVDAQDAACSAQVAVQAAEKLVSDNVVAVVGPYCSSAAIPASTIFHRAGLAMVTPASTNPTLTEQGFDDIFRTIGRDDEEGGFAAGVMVKKLHVTRVAIVHDNSTYGKGLAEQTRDALAKYPGVKVVYFNAIVPGSKDYTSVLTSVRAANPQVTYFTGYYSDGGLLLKQFKQLNVPGTFMAGDANNDPTFLKLAGADGKYAYITTAPIPQLVPSAAHFVKEYTAIYHKGPGAYSAYAYDATNVILRAIEKAKSTSPSAIVSALHQTKNFPGVTGPITFNKIGDRVQIQYIVITVRNGQFVRSSL